MFLGKCLASFGGTITLMSLYSTADNRMGSAGVCLCSIALIALLMIISKHKFRDFVLFAPLLTLSFIRLELLPAVPVAFYTVWCLIDYVCGLRKPRRVKEGKHEIEENLRSFLIRHGRSRDLPLVDKWVREFYDDKDLLKEKLCIRYGSDIVNTEIFAKSEIGLRQPPTTPTHMGIEYERDVVETARKEALIEQSKNIEARVARLVKKQKEMGIL